MQIIFAYGVLLLSPIVSFLYALIGFYKTPSRWKRYLLFYIYFIFIAAYCYMPLEGSNVDLFRYYAILDELKGMNLAETIGRLSDSLYVENILFWLVSKSNMYHILPAITTATVYGIGAYIACDMAQAEDFRYLYIILIIEAVMVPFFSVVVNIRNVFAFSLVILASYLELYKQKRTLGVLLLYVIPVFLHKTGIVILIVRLLVPLFKRAYVVALVMIFGLSELIIFAHSHITFIRFGGAFGRIIRKLINSSYRYLLGESEYAARVRNSTGAAITRYMVFAFLILMLALYIQKFRLNRKLLDFEIMGYMLCILSLSCNVIDTPAYWRFAAAFCLMIPSIMYSFYRGDLINGNIKRLIRSGLAVYLVLRFMIMMQRASIDWMETFSALAVTNIYTLIVQLVVSILTA